jgi:hypothetical protein
MSAELEYLECTVVVFAVARLTRLICTDKISERWRASLVRRLPEGSMWSYLLFCRWCMSVWFAFPAAAVWLAVSSVPAWSGRWWIDLPTVGLALSYATGLLVGMEPEA